MYREIPLPPPSIWDPNSILTAIKTIAYRTGNFNPAPGGALSPGTLRIYNDPCTALGAGSGVWQIELTQNMEMPGETDGMITFVIRYQGNASTSVGGFPAAPMPALNGYIFSAETGPMFPLPSFAPSQSSGNMSILRPSMCATWDEPYPFYTAGNFSVLLYQLYTSAVDAAGPGGTVGVMEYWSDPQTAIGTGTGDWLVSIKAWTAGSAGLSILKIGGKAIQMRGGPPAVPCPVNWNYNGSATYHAAVSVYQPAYYTYSLLAATAVNNRFSL